MGIKSEILGNLIPIYFNPEVPVGVLNFKFIDRK